MRGIAGVYGLDGAPAKSGDLRNMVGMLERRGPDGSGVWCEGAVGLGHASLVTTPEAALVRLPHAIGDDSLVITADARLDNREELLGLLGMDQREPIGDAGLILRAYERWGEECPEKFLGDFSFAIWDARRQALFCARDHFGVRPFYYYHDPGRLFVLASEPRAILVLETVPYRIHEPRIADFLITQLEGIDKTSTFFEGVYRLPPAHSLTVTAKGLRMRRYWSLEPGTEVSLGSDEEYAEAFLEVFTRAVESRLGGDQTIGVLLSGGMDSGSVVAVAKELLAERGKGPLPTFSGVGTGDPKCIESKTIQEYRKVEGLEPGFVATGALGSLLPRLQAEAWDLAEPFDLHMTVIKAGYLLALQNGTEVLMDGVDGDLLLSPGTYLARLFRKGKILLAFRESRLENVFWGISDSVVSDLAKPMLSAFSPGWVRGLWRTLRYSKSKRAAANIRDSLISPDFASRISLEERLEALDQWRGPGFSAEFVQERAAAMNHPNLTAGLERYHRVAAAVGVEPRHPFLDVRLAEWATRLPGEQRLQAGWPKAVLRRAMKGRLPDQVLWRRGKEHLGQDFTQALIAPLEDEMRVVVEEGMDVLSGYIDVVKVRSICRSYFGGEGASAVDPVYEAAQLSVWLRKHETRPRIGAGKDPGRIRTGFSEGMDEDF